jgi:hypothetical protein
MASGDGSESKLVILAEAGTQITTLDLGPGFRRDDLKAWVIRN